MVMRTLVSSVGIFWHYYWVRVWVIGSTKINMDLQVIKKLLINHKWFRERKLKWLGIAKLLRQRHPSLEGIADKIIADIIAESATLDRAWRKTLAENPDLRGMDYRGKKELVRQTQKELGYAVSSPK